MTHSRYPDDDGAGLTGADLVDWFRTGHEALVATLADADPDVQTFMFLPAPSALAFWARRQTHETGIHRADVESGGGPITPFELAEALDGIDELVGGFAARKGKDGSRPARALGVLPTDSELGWLARPGTEPVRIPPRRPARTSCCAGRPPTCTCCCGIGRPGRSRPPATPLRWPTGAPASASAGADPAPADPVPRASVLGGCGPRGDARRRARPERGQSAECVRRDQARTTTAIAVRTGYEAPARISPASSSATSAPRSTWAMSPTGAAPKPTSGTTTVS